MKAIDEKTKAAVGDLKRRKAISRAFMRSLPLEKKIEELAKLQERYYAMLELRELNGGKPIPERWRKWRSARDNS